MTAPVRPSRRGPLLGLGVGLVLAALLAVVLAGGMRRSTGAGPDVGPSTPAGLTAADAGLLELDTAAAGTHVTAPAFTLTDQHGRPTSLAQFRGKVVVWSLNDDRCTDLCTLLAQDIVIADRDLGPAARDVEWLSVNANPYYPSVADVASWTDRNDLGSLPNWSYVTGTPAQLGAVWAAYHAQVTLDPTDRTVDHSTTIDYIDPAGDTEGIGNFGQGAVSSAYYAHAMAQVADDLLPASERVTVGGDDIDAAVTRGATIGDRAPAFALPLLGGGGRPDTLTSLDSGPLVVNFWSSTCTICVQEMPALQKVDDDFAGAVHFVGIDVADPRSAAASFATGLGVHYTLLADADGTAAAAYDVDALPVTLVISPSGTILARHDGLLTHDQLEAVLEMDFPSVPLPAGS